MEKYKIEVIKRIIRECEEVQESAESDYTKRCAKLTAYNEIKEELFGNKESDKE